MTRLIKARGLSKFYRNKQALKSVDFELHQGKIVGLVGPNGAGKTTILKAILGLTSFDGELEVLGMNPATERHQIMQNVSFIADVAVLPRWLKVSEALTFMQDVHPKFNLEKAKGFLQKNQNSNDSQGQGTF
ncbi:MAG: ATP-binding cassette domain-containing protein [Enterobacterales bacterium]|nr:ATP-binding cassette domain-containing protein [Enterobacterales bacterium]